MTKEEFFKKRCIRFEREKTQHTGSFSHLRSNGFCYQMFICVVTMEPFNPWMKSNEGREYKCFQSSISAADCKEQAWDYISQFK